MTTFQPQFRRENRAKSGALPVVAVLCLVLLALLAVVQVAHIHATETAADHCPLCISMHSAAPVEASATAVVLVQIGTPTPVVPVRAAIRNWYPKLFTRPPPSAS